MQWYFLEYPKFDFEFVDRISIVDKTRLEILSRPKAPQRLNLNTLSS